MKVRSIKRRMSHRLAAALAKTVRQIFVTQYVVARKKDGIEVGRFFVEDEAQALVDKAKASKKASLFITPVVVPSAA